MNITRVLVLATGAVLSGCAALGTSAPAPNKASGARADATASASMPMDCPMMAGNDGKPMDPGMPMGKDDMSMMGQDMRCAGMQDTAKKPPAVKAPRDDARIRSTQ